MTISNKLPNPICVTAFLTPKAIIDLDILSDSSSIFSSAPAQISVGKYMSDHTITNIVNFSNAANALKYAFKLKADNCPISKNAFAVLQAEIKRTNAIPSSPQKPIEQPSEISPEHIGLPKSGCKPIKEQFVEMKKKHPDAILLFRVGDFYETFNEDAVEAADILGITLTHRAENGNYTQLAGFPHHALDIYLPRLVRAGKRVAICEQLSPTENREKA